LKQKSRHKKRAKRDALKFARYVFWVSWIWVLLFAVGELLEAVHSGYYGSKTIFCIVTLLAISSGGFALERALQQVGAVNKSRRSRVNERGAINEPRRKNPEAEIAQEPLIRAAEFVADNAESKPDEPPKRRRSKA
jgi:hypothetical protein